MVKFKRSRMPSKHIYYTLYLLVLFWSFIKKDIREAFIIAICQKKSHINQSGIRYNIIIINQPTKKVWQKKRTKISQFIIIDKTVIKVGREEEEKK